MVIHVLQIGEKMIKKLFSLVCLLSLCYCALPPNSNSQVQEVYATYPGHAYVAGIGMVGRIRLTAAGQEKQYIYIECLHIKDSSTYLEMRARYENDTSLDFDLASIEQHSQGQCKVPVKREFSASQLQNLFQVLHEKYQQAKDDRSHSRFVLGVMHAVTFIINPVVTVGSLVLFYPRIGGFYGQTIPAGAAMREVEGSMGEADSLSEEKPSTEFVSLKELRDARRFFIGLLKDQN